MKDCILNVVYDTRTAEAFAELESDCEPPDPSWFHETLYRNKSGYWFLAGAGGSRSRFAVEYLGFGRLGAAGIIPIGRRQAMAWLVASGNHIDVLRDHFMDENVYLKDHHGIEL